MSESTGKRWQPIGLWLDPKAHTEAKRIASAGGLRTSQVIRLAIDAGLPVIARRILGDDDGAAA